MLLELSTVIITTLSSLTLAQPKAPTPTNVVGPIQEVVASDNYSLSNRYSNSFVNNVFVDNILLTLAYMSGNVRHGEPIAWDSIRQIKEFRLEIKPHQTFAFHDKVLDKYKNADIVTTNAHFIGTEGFRSDGYLVGDGVCHLASFMKVAAQQANLLVEAPTNHDFAKIADVEKENGVAIYYSESGTGSERENLYITNPFDNKVEFIFEHNADSLAIKVVASS